MELSRRTYLQGVGALAVASMAGLSGCASGQAKPVTEPEPRTRLPTEPSYDDWFDGVGTYRGTDDLRGRETVTVTVGAKDAFGYFAFDPAAIAVSPGTTVTWVWSGEGGGHDVVALDGTFASPLSDRPGTTFGHTFDASGVVTYYCTPHRGMGMRGAVAILD